MNLKQSLKAGWRSLGWQKNFEYWRALDDVYDHALDPNNPCHDEVRAWITKRRKQITDYYEGKD